jgi:hypothetical protein
VRATSVPCAPWISQVTGLRLKGWCLGAVCDSYNKFKVEMINELMAAGTTTTGNRTSSPPPCPTLDSVDSLQILRGVSTVGQSTALATLSTCAGAFCKQLGQRDGL